MAPPQKTPGRLGTVGNSSKFDMRSPRYTTRIDELPTVR
ncbi:DUF4113 domain-containing protein [Methylorubrum populi]